MKDLKLMTPGDQLDEMNATNSVAVSLGEVELNDLIQAAETAAISVMGNERRAVFDRMAQDFKKLRKEAFGR